MSEMREREKRREMRFTCQRNNKRNRPTVDTCITNCNLYLCLSLSLLSICVPTVCAIGRRRKKKKKKRKSKKERKSEREREEEMRGEASIQILHDSVDAHLAGEGKKTQSKIGLNARSN